MPQKPNRSGQMQNYVPAGNGDASGEYGDNASGSNIHYKSADIIANIKKKFEEKTDVKGRDGQYDYVKKHSTYRGKVLESLNEIIKNADEESVKLLNNAYGKNHYQFSIGSGVYYNGAKSIKCDRADFLNTKSYGVPGSTWFHENGHLLDYSKGAYYPMSYTYKNKDGKSLNDIVKEELETLPVDEIKEYKKIIKEQILKENGYTMTEYKMLSDAFENDPRIIEGLRLRKEYMEILDKKVSYWNLTAEDREKLIKSSQLRDEAINDHSELRNLNDKLKETSKRFETISTAISDAYSSKVRFGFGVGHSISYYNQREYGLGAEFFANVFSDRTVNKEAYEFTKKYMPKSVAMFEEILEEFKK